MGLPLLHARFVTQLSLVVLLVCSTVGGLQAQEVANGVFLVARPTLNDPTFRRTVILITQPPGSGPIGVIVNRPTALSVADVLPAYKLIAAQTRKLHFGGPVQQRSLVFLVRTSEPPPRAVAVLRDVYMTTDADWVEAALGESEAPLAASAVRVYAGYSGWVKGQLDNELEREGWYIVPADSDVVFDKAPGEIWGELLKRAMFRNTQHNP